MVSAPVVALLLFFAWSDGWTSRARGGGIGSSLGVLETRVRGGRKTVHFRT